MKLSNVLLIWRKELRDQLRDRRTIFMIAVLPLLLYPLLGLSFIQVAQFLREHSSRIVIVEANEAATSGELALLDGDEIAKAFCPDIEQRALLKVDRRKSTGQSSSDAIQYAAQLRSGDVDAVILLPRGNPIPAEPTQEADANAVTADAAKNAIKNDSAFENVNTGAEAHGDLNAVDTARETSNETNTQAYPAPILMHNSAKERSRVAESRMVRVLERWHQALIKQRVREAGVRDDLGWDFNLNLRDVSEKSKRDAALWSRLLPFVALVWSLTGAFYPAVDVCAGEKERGTLETLLCSAAKRAEIVWGKLLTVMTFSVATSLLNLAALSIVGVTVMRYFASHTSAIPTSPPQLSGLLWLAAALIPISALFSALCVALAAFAKSSKEGQYYLMPLMLVGMPLMMLATSPGAELNLGSSLIPLTGLMLLLRSLMEGEWFQAAPFIPPVLIVTSVGCYAAIRWAVDQFNREDVLFRESERFSPGLWIAQILREREDLPNTAEAFACGLGILILQFVMSFSLKAPTGPADIPAIVLIPQLAVIATPAVLMAVMLTRRPTTTLRLDRFQWWSIPVGALLALCVHPVAAVLKAAVFQLYPPRAMPDLEMLQNYMLAPDALSWVLLLFAVTPAVCEELAFRGFILSGLNSRGVRWPAVAISAAFFAAVHPLVQQAIVAGFLGLLLGWLAMRTRSLWLGIAFHASHNALMILTARWQHARPWFTQLLHPLGDNAHWYGWPVTLAAIAATLLIIGWVARQTGNGRSADSKARGESLPLVHPTPSLSAQAAAK